MATLKAPFALDRSLNTTEVTPRNIADVLAEGLSHITGRTASEVEYDNTDSGLTSDDVQGAIDELSERPTLPTTDIQTAVDEFETYNGGLLSECKVALSPNQDLHGYDSPWVGGAGKNKVPFFTSSTVSDRVWTVSDDGIITITGTSTGNSYKVKNITLPAGTYQLSGGDPNGVSGTGDEYVQVDGVVVARSYGNTNQTFTLSEEKTVTLALRDFQTAGNSDTHVFKPMICLTSAVEPLVYEPYENICPISGHTQAKVGDDGKNRLEDTFNTGTLLGVAITAENGVIDLNGTGTGTNAFAIKSRNTSGNYIYMPKGNYIFSAQGIGSGVVIGTTYNGAFSEIARNDSGESVSFSITDNTPSDYKLSDGSVLLAVYIGISARTYNHQKIYPMIRLASDTDPTFAPYNGYQVTVNLGGTYYSGTLDVVSGVLTVDKKSVEYDGSNDENWIKVSGEYRYYIEKSSDINANPDGSTSNEFKYSGTSGASVPDGQFYVGGTNLGVRLNTITSVADWKTFLSNKPFMVVYPLATPFTIQLIPTPVKANVGENHLSAPLEGQEITEVKFRELFTWDEVEAYVNAHIGGGSGMNYSTSEQVIGTWIDGKTLCEKVVIGISAYRHPSLMDLGIPISETIVKAEMQGIATISGTDYVVSGSTFLWSISQGQNNGVVYISKGTTNYEAYYNGSSTSDVNLIIQYTKTTD